MSFYGDTTAHWNPNLLSGYIQVDNLTVGETRPGSSWKHNDSWDFGGAIGFPAASGYAGYQIWQPEQWATLFDEPQIAWGQSSIDSDGQIIELSKANWKNMGYYARPFWLTYAQYDSSKTLLTCSKSADHDAISSDDVFAGVKYNFSQDEKRKNTGEILGYKVYGGEIMEYQSKRIPTALRPDPVRYVMDVPATVYIKYGDYYYIPDYRYPGVGVIPYSAYNGWGTFYSTTTDADGNLVVPNSFTENTEIQGVTFTSSYDKYPIFSRIRTHAEGNVSNQPYFFDTSQWQFNICRVNPQRVKYQATIRSGAFGIKYYKNDGYIKNDLIAYFGIQLIPFTYHLQE